jgi:hypothetical protein
MVPIEAGKKFPDVVKNLRCPGERIPAGRPGRTLPVAASSLFHHLSWNDLVVFLLILVRLIQ